MRQAAWRTTWRALRPLLPIALLLGVAGIAPGHGSWDELLSRVDARIAADPYDPEAYLARAELLLRCRRIDAARSDLVVAGRMGADWRSVEILRAEAFRIDPRPEHALAVLDQLLEEDPANPAALRMRGTLRASLADPAGAAADLDAAASQLTRSDPDLFLQLARAHEAQDDREAALATLAQAQSRWGRMPVLELEAVRYEAELGRSERALDRLTGLQAVLSSMELWERRGDLLRSAGRTEDARVAYLQALGAIDALPETIQARPVWTQVRRRVTLALESNLERSKNP